VYIPGVPASEKTADDALMTVKEEVAWLLTLLTQFVSEELSGMSKV
jgi:hypothetical protein